MWLDLGAALAPFAPDHELAQTYYREFVALKITSNERLWDRVINGIYLGSHCWAKSIRETESAAPLGPPDHLLSWFRLCRVGKRLLQDSPTLERATMNTP